MLYRSKIDGTLWPAIFIATFSDTAPSQVPIRSLLFYDFKDRIVHVDGPVSIEKLFQMPLPWLFWPFSL
jgi:hypothetical protein